MRIAARICGSTSGALAVAGLAFLGAVGGSSVALEAAVRARLDPSAFDAPTRFYARPTALAAGEVIDVGRITRALERLGYERTWRSRVGVGAYRLGSRTLVIGRRAFRHYDRLDPGGTTIVELGYGGRVWAVRDAAGRDLRSVTLEPELVRSVYGGDVEDRIPVPLADVPQHLIDAVLTVEDQRFYDHGGLDIRRVAGAMLANARARRIVQGASTITQQLAKNLFLSPRRTPVRKVRELAMALVLETRYEKDVLLEAYLNEVYLGQDGAVAIHGVGQAAQFYFGKDVSQLDVAESALLAGLIRGPSVYSPFRHPEAATRRRNLVLDLLRDAGVTTDRVHASARSAPLGLRAPRSAARAGRYFADYVAAGLRDRHGANIVRGGGAVFTTLDVEMQLHAERAVRTGLERIERNAPRLIRDGGSLQAALVALNPRTGEVLAMVGGRDYGRSQFNRAVLARRQPGSAFKPIVALAALSAPRERDTREPPHFTLASVLADEPLTVETPAGVWAPENYDRRFRGDVTLRDALERSLNVPFARLGLAVGPERIVSAARRLGIAGPLSAVPSIALGSNEVTPLDLTRAYGVLAANGYRAELNTTVAVFDRSGALIEQRADGGEQAYDAAETYLVTSALRGAVERGTGRALRGLGYRGAVAAKSGTTNDFRDAWFIGYTPSLVVGVWVGFDDGGGIGLPGSRAALPIFAAFLRNALGPTGEDAEFSMPYGVEIAEVDMGTGLRAGRGCRGAREVFLRGTAPETRCAPWSSSWRRYGDGARRLIREELAPLIQELRRRVSRRRGGG